MPLLYKPCTLMTRLLLDKTAYAEYNVLAAFSQLAMCHTQQQTSWQHDEHILARAVMSLPMLRSQQAYLQELCQYSNGCWPKALLQLTNLPCCEVCAAVVKCCVVKPQTQRLGLGVFEQARQVRPMLTGLLQHAAHGYGACSQGIALT